MEDPVDIDRIAARSASDEQIALLLHDTRDEILLGLLENPRVGDRQICLLLGRKELSSVVLEAIAGLAVGLHRYPVRRALAFHPRVPHAIGVRLVRELHGTDLVQLMLSPSGAPALRHLAEELILARLVHMPPAQKITLARRGSARIAGALLAEGHADVFPIALDSPFLNEGQVTKVLGRPALPAPVVAAIAQHGRWSHIYGIRLALLRHPQVPLAAAIEFLRSVSTPDLRVLSQLSSLPGHVRPHLQRELASRFQPGARAEARRPRPRNPR
jgi:hypothetical protein